MELNAKREAKNAKTAIARTSGRERCLHVYGKIRGQNDATANLWLGTLPYMTDKAEIARECKRQWPAHWKVGMRVVEHP